MQKLMFKINSRVLNYLKKFAVARSSNSDLYGSRNAQLGTAPPMQKKTAEEDINITNWNATNMT